MKADDITETIRHLSVMRSKAEARLEALREVGVDVAKWLQKADDQEQGKADRLDVNGMCVSVCVCVCVCECSLPLT